jgi:hypothetical protein
VLVVDAVVEAQNILSDVKRVWLLIERVVGSRSICVSRGQALHHAVNGGKCLAVGGDSTCRNDVSRETGGAIGSATGAGSERVSDKAVVCGPNNTIRTPESEREITEPLGARRKRLLRRARKTAYGLPFHAAEEEELVFYNWPAEAEAIIVIAQRRSSHDLFADTPVTRRNSDIRSFGIRIIRETASGVVEKVVGIESVVA